MIPKAQATKVKTDKLNHIEIRNFYAPKGITERKNKPME